MQNLRYQGAKLRWSGGLGFFFHKVFILPHSILLGHSQGALSTFNTLRAKYLHPDYVVDRRLDVWHRLLFGALDGIRLMRESMAGGWCPGVTVWLHVELIVVLLDLKHIEGAFLPCHSREGIISYRLLAFTCGREMRKFLNTLKLKLLLPFRAAAGFTLLNRALSSHDERSHVPLNHEILYICWCILPLRVNGIQTLYSLAIFRTFLGLLSLVVVLFNLSFANCHFLFDRFAF